MSLVNYSIRIEAELREKIKTLCKEKNMKVGALLDLALNYIESEEKVKTLKSNIEKIEEQMKQIQTLVDEKEKGIKAFD